jgi:hypothetical protein
VYFDIPHIFFIHRKNDKNTFSHIRSQKPFLALKFSISTRLLARKSEKISKLNIQKFAFGKCKTFFHRPENCEKYFSILNLSKTALHTQIFLPTNKIEKITWRRCVVGFGKKYKRKK